MRNPNNRATAIPAEDNPKALALLSSMNSPAKKRSVTDAKPYYYSELPEFEPIFLSRESLSGRVREASFDSNILFIQFKNQLELHRFDGKNLMALGAYEVPVTAKVRIINEDRILVMHPDTDEYGTTLFLIMDTSTGEVLMEAAIQAADNQRHKDFIIMPDKTTVIVVEETFNESRKHLDSDLLSSTKTTPAEDEENFRAGKLPTRSRYIYDYALRTLKFCANGDPRHPFDLRDVEEQATRSKAKIAKKKNHIVTTSHRMTPKLTLQKDSTVDIALEFFLPGDSSGHVSATYDGKKVSDVVSTDLGLIYQKQSKALVPLNFAQPSTLPPSLAVMPRARSVAVNNYVRYTGELRAFRDPHFQELDQGVFTNRKTPALIIPPPRLLDEHDIIELHEELSGVTKLERLDKARKLVAEENRSRKEQWRKYRERILAEEAKWSSIPTFIVMGKPIDTAAPLSSVISLEEEYTFVTPLPSNHSGKLLLVMGKSTRLSTRRPNVLMEINGMVSDRLEATPSGRFSISLPSAVDLSDSIDYRTKGFVLENGYILVDSKFAPPCLLKAPEPSAGDKNG